MIICDRCESKELPAYRVDRVIAHTSGVEHRLFNRDIDLCQKCLEALCVMVRDFLDHNVKVAKDVK